MFGGLGIASLVITDDVVLLASSSSDLQLSLEEFAAECESAGMRSSISKSEVMVLNRKRVDGPLSVREVMLPGVEELKHLRILFTSEGSIERETDRCIRAASAVMLVKMPPGLVVTLGGGPRVDQGNTGKIMSPGWPVNSGGQECLGFHAETAALVIQTWISSRR